MEQMIEYKCPCCGGAIEFSPTSQKLKCPYCDTEFETNTLIELSQSDSAQAQDDMTWSEPSKEVIPDDSGLLSFICNSCGGEIITDENTAATKCPYCSNPVVMTGRLSGALKPDYIIPFKLDKNAAMDALRRHVSNKRLLPKVFKDENHIKEIKGIYVPFWLFDAEADADVNYTATRVRAWSDTRFNYTETSYYSVARSASVGFERIPVDGSSKMPDDLMESLEPYDFTQAVDFNTAYLAGYLADKYDVSSDDSKQRANERIKSTTKQEIRNTVHGYATVIESGGSVRLKNSSLKYALYPVWHLTTDWNGQKYTFAMNGQTGKFVGDLPVDKSAYTKWLLGVAAIASAAAFAALTLFSLI